MNEYLASERFTNKFGSCELSNLLEAELFMACQPSLETNLDYIYPDANAEPPRKTENGPLIPPGQESNPLNQQPLSKSISLPAPEVALRSASRKSKNRKHCSAATSNQTQAREYHNDVEKHYRARLKTKFERLLAVLPAAQARSLADRDTATNVGRVLSRGEILDMARDRILALEGKIEFMRNTGRNGYHLPYAYKASDL
jgi:hypothetical protein